MKSNRLIAKHRSRVRLRLFRTIWFVLLPVFALCVHMSFARAQLTPEQTGVPNEALQHTFEDYMSFGYSHGQLCQKTLKQLVPGIRGIPSNLIFDLNVAGVITSRWQQEVTKNDGTSPVIWQFECVSQLRASKRLALLSIVMYEEKGAERRGVELLTRRDVRIVHSPK